MHLVSFGSDFVTFTNRQGDTINVPSAIFETEERLKDLTRAQREAFMRVLQHKDMTISGNTKGRLRIEVKPRIVWSHGINDPEKGFSKLFDFVREILIVANRAAAAITS